MTFDFEPVVLLSERLEALRAHLPKEHHEEMDSCISVAQTWEEPVLDPKKRIGKAQPKTSRKGITSEKMKGRMKDILKAWREYPSSPLSEMNLIGVYQEMYNAQDPEAEGAIKFIKFDASTWSATRRNMELNHMVRVVDNKGKSRTGKSAHRYILLPGWRKLTDKSVCYCVCHEEWAGGAHPDETCVCKGGTGYADR